MISDDSFNEANDYVNDDLDDEEYNESGSPVVQSEDDYLDDFDMLDDYEEDDGFGYGFVGREEIPGADYVEPMWWDELIP